MIYKIKKLNFKYKSGFELRDVNFEIERNKIYSILGLNGSGKTTLIKLLAGIYKSSSGSIELNNKDIDKYSLYEKSKYISYVPQVASNRTSHTVVDYLSFSLSKEYKWYSSPSIEDDNKIVRFANKLNIAHLLYKKVNEISGGERQLVQICRSLIQETDVIILDEPTSALDIKNQAVVLNLIKDLSVSENKTIIFSTHNPNHSLKLNAKVIIVEDGKIIDLGDANEVIKVDKLKYIYGTNITYSKSLDYDEISYKL